MTTLWDQRIIIRIVHIVRIVHMARTALTAHTARIVLTIRAGLLNESMSLRKPRLSAWLFLFVHKKHFVHTCAVVRAQ